MPSVIINGEFDRWTTTAILRRAMDLFPPDSEIYVNRVQNLNFYSPGEDGDLLGWLEFHNDTVQFADERPEVYVGEP